MAIDWIADLGDGRYNFGLFQLCEVPAGIMGYFGYSVFLELESCQTLLCESVERWDWELDSIWNDCCNLQNLCTSEGTDGILEEVRMRAIY